MLIDAQYFYRGAPENSSIHFVPPKVMMEIEKNINGSNIQDSNEIILESKEDDKLSILKFIWNTVNNDYTIEDGMALRWLAATAEVQPISQISP